MLSYKLTKPLVWAEDIDRFKSRMKDLGFQVEPIGKPETLEGLCIGYSRDASEFDEEDSRDLTEESRTVIQEYLGSKNADGLLVIDKEKLGERGGCTYECALTILPYRLVQLNEK